MKSRRDVEGLIRATKHKDWDVQLEAVKALREVGKADLAREHLIQALKNRNAEIRLRAAQAFSEIGAKPKNQIERAWYFIAKQEWDKLLEMGQYAAEPLSQLVLDWVALDIKIRWMDRRNLAIIEQAIMLWGKIGGTRVLEFFSQILESSRWRPLDTGAMAKALINTGLSLNPNDQQEMNQISQAFHTFALQAYSRALEAGLPRAASYEPGGRDTAKWLGNEFKNWGWRQGIEFVTEALMIAPKSVNLWLDKGDYHMSLGEREQAVSCYDKACDIGLHSEEQRMRLVLFKVRCLGGDIEEVSTTEKGYNLTISVHLLGYQSPDDLSPLVKGHYASKEALYSYTKRKCAEIFCGLFISLPPAMRLNKAIVKCLHGVRHTTVSEWGDTKKSEDVATTIYGVSIDGREAAKFDWAGIKNEQIESMWSVICDTIPGLYFKSN